MRQLAATTRVVQLEDACDGMIRLTDLLGRTTMEFFNGEDHVCPGRYIIEVRRDGSLMSMRAMAERWTDDDEAQPAQPTPEVLADMYAQIVPTAAQYLAENGEKPPLLADMYDLMAMQGFDLSMVERVERYDPATLQ